jgi:hypothetical protein
MPESQFKPEYPQVWALCMHHGARLARREDITQLGILALYDGLVAEIERLRAVWKGEES